MSLCVFVTERVCVYERQRERERERERERVCVRTADTEEEYNVCVYM